MFKLCWLYHIPYKLGQVFNFLRMDFYYRIRKKILIFNTLLLNFNIYLLIIRIKLHILYMNYNHNI